MQTRNIRSGLFGMFMVALGSLMYSQTTPAKIGVQVGAGLSGTFFHEGYGVNADLFINNWDLSGGMFFSGPFQKVGIVEVAFIKKDLGRILQFGGGINYSKAVVSISEQINSSKYHRVVHSVGISIISRLRIVKDLNGEMKLGGSLYHLSLEDEYGYYTWTGKVPFFQLGLNYQFYLKGKRDTTPGIKADYFDGGKLAFNYRFGSQITSFLNLGSVLNGGEHHFSASYKVNQWLHPYVGGILGPWYSAYRDAVDLPFTLKGIEVGARAYTVQREHCAIYQDVSYGYVKRPNIYLYQSRFSMGNFFSVKLHPALRANAGLLLNFYDQDVLVEMSAGISVTPFFNTGIMGEK